MPVTEAIHKDQSVIEGILKQDHLTLKNVYRQSLPTIVSLVTKNGGSKEDALDVFQDALVIIFRKAQSGSLILSSSFNTYLYAICRNLWLKKIKRKSVIKVTNEADDGSIIDEYDIDTATDKHLRYQLYKKKMDQLGRDCQSVLRMFFEGIHMKVIAEKMGYASEQYAKKRKFKCKEKLIQLIKNDPLFSELVD